MENNKNSFLEIAVDDKGCATVCGDLYSEWRTLDAAMVKNGSTLNGFTLKFDHESSAKAWLKRAADMCFLFRYANLKAWRMLGPEAEVSK